MNEPIDGVQNASPSHALEAVISQRAGLEPTGAAKAVADNLCSLFPDAALLFYGSGNSVSRSEEPTSMMYDFYVVGESYEKLFDKRWLRLANRLIPPNVFYLETPSAFGLLRAKYAVLSIDHFEKLVSTKTFHSYFWARFAQPCAIIDPAGALRSRLSKALASSIITFAARAAPLLNTPFEAADLWLAGLGASYKAELRAEDQTRVKKLITSYGDWVERVTGPALACAFGDEIQSTATGFQLAKSGGQWRASAAWRLRSIFGGFLSVARLLKGTQTFSGGIEYITWKIERHSGVAIPLKEWEKDHPMIAAPVVALRYYRLKSGKRG